MKKTLIITAALFSVILIGAGQTQLSFSSSDLSVQESSTTGDEWTVYFTPGEAEQLDFTTDHNADLDVKSIEYYRNGAWTNIQTDGSLPASFEWPEDAEQGRIVMNVTELHDFTGTLTTGTGESIEIPTNPSLQQQKYLLNLDDQNIDYSLCGFGGDFRECGSSVGAGILNLDNSSTKTFEIPENSQITDLTLNLDAIDNSSIKDFSGGNMLFGDTNGDGESEVIIYEDTTVDVFDLDGNSLQTYTTNYTINDVAAGSVVREEGVNSGDNLIVSTTNSLTVFGGGTKEWSVTGEEFDNVATGEVSSDKQIFSPDDGSAESMQCIGCDGSSSTFNIPGTVNESQEVFYLNLGLNYIDKSKNLELEIGSETYSLDTQELQEDSIVEAKNDDGSVEQMVKTNEGVKLETPEEDLSAEKQYLKLPVSKPVNGEYGKVNISFNESTYNFGTDEITTTTEKEVNKDYSELNGLIRLQDSIEVDTGTLNENRSSYIRLPVNKHPDEDSGSIVLQVNGNSYTVDTSNVTSESIKEYKSDNGNSIDAVKVVDNNVDFNLSYDMPENISAEKLYIKTGIAKVGSGQGNLTLSTGSNTYKENLSKIGTDSSESYSIYDNNNSDERYCIGCENSTEAEFDTSAFDTENYGETVDITVNTCRVGEPGDLRVGGPAVDSTFSINSKEVGNCSSGDNSVTIQADGSNLEPGFLQFYCDSCNRSNSYRIGLDTSTTGSYSRIYNNSIQNYNEDLPGDFLVSLDTDTSLSYEFLNTEINASEIAQGQNITYGCEGCSPENGYRIMQSDASTGNTWNNGQPVANDIISRVFTNTSLERDWVRTRVDNQDLIDDSQIAVDCINCQEGFNILSDTDSSGSTYHNGTALNRDSGLEIIQYPVNREWKKIQISKQDDLGTVDVESNTTVYLGLDQSSSASASKSGEELNGGSTARLWSNRSLEYSEIRVEVNKTDLQNNDNATLTCNNCGSPAYNLMIDDSSTLDSWRNQNGNTEQVNGGYIASLESYGSNIGGEVAASQFPSEVTVFNSTGSKLWNLSLNDQVEDIEIGDVDSSTGNEVVAATRDHLQVISSTGTGLREYPEGTNEWFKAIEIDGSKIIAGTDSGVLKSVDSSNNIVWERNLGSRVNSLAKGEIVKDVESSLAVGQSDGDIEIYDLSGNSIANYTRSNGVKRIDSGESADINGELLGVTSDQIDIFDLYSLPENLEVSINGDTVTTETGLLRNEVVTGDTSVLQNQLSGCTNGTCNIPIQFSSDSPAKINVSNFRADFTYDINDTIEAQDDVSRWEQTTGIETGQSIRNQALEINYSSSPAIPVQVNRLVSNNIQSIDGSKTNITFNNRTFVNPNQPNIDLREGRTEFLLTPSNERNLDVIWYDDSSSVIPVTSSTTELDTSGSVAERNINISRATGATDTVFRNVTHTIELNESAITGGQFIEVDWTGTGYTDITPVTEGCTTYSEHEVDGDTFRTCLEDTNGNDVAETIKVIQPRVGANTSDTALTTYNVGGSSNYPPEIDKVNITPTSDYWNRNHTVNVSFSDQDGDSIEASLWINTPNGWLKEETITNGLNQSFKFETNKTWTGERDLLIEYTDVNNNGDAIRPRTNSTTYSFTVNPHPTTVELINDYKTEKDRIGENAEVEVVVRDKLTGDPIGGSEAICYLNTENEFSHEIQTTNQNGQCSMELGDLSSAPLGDEEWWIEASGQDYYTDNQSSRDNITLIGNFDYDVSLDNNRIFVPNGYGLNETAEITVDNIQDLTGTGRNPEYDVIWTGDEIYSQTASNNKITAETTYRAGTSPGTYDLRVELQDSLFNNDNITRQVQLWDGFDARLSTSDDVIDKSERVNLTARFVSKDESGNNESVIPDSVSYDTPSGYCSTEYVNGNEYTCEFVPASDLESGTYQWSVQASKDKHRFISSNDTFEISGDIVADIAVEQNELSRLESGSRTNTLDYKVENVTDESGNKLQNVDYNLSISGEKVDSGTTGNDNDASDSFTLSNDRAVGPNDVEITIKASGKQLSYTETVTVYGRLNVTLTSSGNSVYISNSVTENNASFNTETNLTAAAENYLGENVNADIEYSPATGACNINGDNCTLEPGNTNPGDYSWSATADAQYYEPDTSDANTVTVKNVVTISDITETVKANFTEQSTFQIDIQNPSGESVNVDGLNVNYYQNNFGITSGTTDVSFTPQCSDYSLGPQTEYLDLEGSTEFYDVYSTNRSFELEVFNVLDPDITSPLDSSDPSAENYRQGDEVQMELDLSGSCSTSGDDYQILWTAQSQSESSVVSSGSSTAWTIEDRFSGPTDIIAEIDNDYYLNNTDSNEIIIDKVLNNDITAAPTEYTREIGGTHTTEYVSKLKTGQGVLANESSISEDWSNFEVAWYIDGNQVATTTTNSNGVARETLSLDGTYSPGDVNVKAELYNTSNIDTRILKENDSEITTLKDEAEININHPANGQEVFYTDEITLDSNINLATVDNPDNIQGLGVSWSYDGPLTSSPNTVSSDQQTIWTIPSYVYGNGNLTAEVNAPLIRQDSTNNTLIGKRKVSIESFQAPQYLEPNAVNTLTADISVNGLNDLSGYEVELWRGTYGSNTLTSETNQQGTAALDWDTSTFEKGAYDIGVRIFDSSTEYFETETPEEVNETVVIPDTLNISSYFRDNLEKDPRGNRFPNLGKEVVYRNGGPWNHPETMHLAANVTTPFQSSDELYEVENSTVQYWIQGESADGQQINEKIGEDKVNLTEFKEGRNDNINQWWDAYLTYIDWEPRGDFPVGRYDLKINATHPEEDFSTQSISDVPIEVRGNLNVTITDPQPYENTFQSENFTMSAKVEDMNGNEFSASELDEIHWTLEEDTCANYGENGGRSGNQVMDWDDATASGPRTGILSTWMVMGDTGNYGIGGSEMVWLDADKKFFESTQNSYRSGFTGCSSVFSQWDDTPGALNDDYEGDRYDRVGQRHDIRAKLKTEWDAPSQTTVETDNNDLLNVTARFLENNTSDPLPDGFNADYYASCLNCSEPENIGKSQNSGFYRDGSQAKFTFNFSNEDYGQNYTFKVWAESNDDDWVANYPLNTTTEKLEVFRDIGSGDGSANINGVCEPNEYGENVMNAPSDCGFDNLPKEYWLNETAQQLEGQLSNLPENYTVQYNRFANESHPDYEANVTYYGEHSLYEDTVAGGCDFDESQSNEEDSVYEDRNTCAEWVVEERPPEIKTTSSSPGYFTDSGPQQIIQAEVDDADGNLDVVQLIRKSDGQLIDSDMDLISSTSYPRTLESQFTPSTSSDTSYKIQASDTSGLTDSQSFTLYYDDGTTAINSINFDEPLIPESDSGSDSDIEVNLDFGTIDQNGIKNITADVDEAGTYELSYQSGNTFTGSFPATDTGEGTGSVTVTANMKSGYSDTMSENYNLDTADPSISNFDITPTLLAEGDTITATADLGDDNNLNNVVLENGADTQICSQSQSGTSGTLDCTVSIQETGTGTFTYTAIVSDTAGRTSTSDVNIDIDNNKPTLSNVNYEEVVEEGTTTTISADADDGESNLESLEVFNQNSNTVECSNDNLGGVSSNSISCDVTPNQNTNYLVRANDSLGNTRKQSFEITTVSEPPNLDFNNPTNSELVADTVGIQVNITDPDNALNTSTPYIEVQDSGVVEESSLSDSGTYWTYDLNTNQISDGSYTLNASASDLGDLYGETLIDIKVDNTQPDIGFENLGSDEVVTGSKNFQFTISDTNPDSSTYDYTITDSSGATNSGSLTGSDSNYETGNIDTTSLSEGDATIEISATDGAGNTNTVSKQFNIDNQAPDVSINSPGDGTHVRNDFTVKAEITDAAGNGDSTTYECGVNGGNYQSMSSASGTNAYSCSINSNEYNDGDQTINVRADDTVGQTGTGSITVTVDNQAPSISSVSLGNTIINSGTQMDVTVDTSDNIGVTSVTAEGTGLSSSGSTWSGSITAEGNHLDKKTVNIASKDQAGNTGTDSSKSYTIDDQAPQYSNQNVDTDYMKSGESVQYDVTVDEEHLVQDSVTIEVVDSSDSVIKTLTENCNFGASSSDCSATWDGTNSEGSNAADGSYRFQISADDKAGNSNTNIHSESVTLDNTDPSFSNYGADKNYIKEGETVEFSVDVNELSLDQSQTDINVISDSSGSSVATLNPTCNGDSGSYTCTAEWTATSGSYSTGSYYPEISSIDRAGNSNTGSDSSANTFLDTQNPSISEQNITNAADTVFNSDQTIDVKVQASDSETFVNTVTAKSTTLQSDTEGLWDGSITPASSEGTYNINVEVKDAADNTVTSDALSYTIDNTDPSVTDLTSNATDGVTRSDAPVKFDVTVTEANLDTIDLEGLEMSSGSGDTYTITTTPNNLGLTEGSNTLTATATDKAENTGTDTLDLYVDDGAPSITNVQVSQNIVQPQKTVTVTADVSDDFVENVTLDHQGNTLNMVETSTTNVYETTLETSGNNEEIITLTVNAIDQAGNTASDSSADYQIDSEPPSTGDLKIAGVNSLASQSSNSSQYSIDVTDNLGVSNVELETPDGKITLSNQGGTTYGDSYTPADLGCPTNEDYVACEISSIGTDNAGNTDYASSNVTVYVDDIAPQINSFTVNNSIVQSGTTVKFEAEITDGDSDLTSTVSNPSGSQICELSQDSGDIYSCTTSVSETGSYLLETTDSADNTRTSSTGIDIDDTAPEVEDVNLNVSYDASRSDESVKYEVKVTDEFLDRVYIPENGGTTEFDMSNPQGDTYTLTKTPQQLGCNSGVNNITCNLEIIGLDKADNEATKQFGQTIDDIDPTITNVDMQDTILKPDSTVDVSVDADSETDSTIDWIEAEPSVQGNRLTYSDQDGNWTGTIQIDNDGVLDILAEDYAGNQGQDPPQGQDPIQSYTVDYEPPTITGFNSNATRNISRSDSSLEFSLSATDNIEMAEVRIGKEGSQQVVSESGGTINAEFTPSDLGCSSSDFSECTITAEAEDQAGYTVTETYDLTIDDVSPSITDISLNDTILSSGSAVEVNVSISGEDNYTVKEVRSQGEVFNWVNSSNHWRGVINPPETSEGDYSLEVEAEDYAGNLGSDSGTVYTIDNTPPNINNLRTNSTDNIETSGSILSYKVDATDANGIQNISVNGEQMTELSGNTYNLTAPLEDVKCTENGICTLNATVYDNAELTNSTAYNITIDNDAPEIVSYGADGVIEGTPYDAALPTFNLDWQVNASSQSNMTAEIYAANYSTGERISEVRDLYEAPPDQGYFTRQLEPQELNATGGLVSFMVNITDDAGNIGQGNYTLNLDTVPPSINGVDTNISNPEVDRELVEIQANVTHNVDVDQVNATITSEDGNVQEEIEMDLPPQNEAENSNGGIFIADFKAPQSGSYDVNIYAEDAFDEFDDETFESVFTAIGKTTLDLTMTPEISEFNDITAQNDGKLIVDTIMTNEGDATAYGTSIPRLSLPEGVDTNSTTKSCGELAAGDSCSVKTRINFTVDTAPGNRNIIGNVFWENPDGTSDIDAKGINTDIGSNPTLDITSDQNDHYQDVIFGESGQINVTIANEGNVPLNQIDASLGTTGLGGSKILTVGSDVSLQTRNISVGESGNTSINILESADERGRYQAELDIDISENYNNCDSTCTDSTEFEMEIFRRSEVQITNSSQELYRNETVNLGTNVTDSDDNLISGYPVNMSINETVLGEASTENDGVLTQPVDVSQFEPGNYTLLAEIEDLESDYYRKDNATDTEEFEVRDKLNISANYSSDSLFWYETENNDDQIKINYTVTNVNGNPVENANITLLSNATTNVTGYAERDYALTDENGTASIVYETLRDSPGDAILRTRVSKNDFFDTPEPQDKSIQIEGGFAARLVNVENGDKILRNKEKELVGEITDDSGDTLDPSQVENITWTLNGTEITAGEDIDQFNWTIPSSQETGSYTLKIEAEDPGVPPATSTAEIGIYEAVNLTGASVSTKLTDRENSEINFDATVENSSDNSVSSYEGCRLLVENSQTNQSATDSGGSCTLDWHTDNQSKVGNNTAEVRLAEDRNGTWYLPNSSKSETFNVFLEEKINLELLKPTNDLYTYEEYSFEANTTDAYGRNLETNTSWFVGEELIGYNSTEWNTTNATLGENTLNVTSERNPFNSTYVEKTLRLFGRSEHTLSVDEEVSRGQNATITVNVTDVNSTEGIEDYNVTLYKTKDGDTEKWDSILTNSTGIAVKEWDTSDAGLGGHNITAELGNSSDLYYNSTSGNITENIYVGGEINTDVEDITEDTIYRDELSQPQNTTLSINSTNDIGNALEDVNNTLIVDNQSVARCATNSTGLCNITWNPNSSTEIGDLSGYINSTSNNYFPANSSTFNIEVRTGSKPEIGINGETGYNFSKSTGVPINVSVLESFTDIAVANYSFDLGWGTRDPLVPIYSNEDNWNADNTSRINSTENNLFINNTTAFRSFEELKEIDRTFIRVEKQEETVWNVSLDTEDGWENISTSDSRIEINTDNTTVNQAIISTSGTVNITEGELGTLELDNRRELMESELLGEETGSTTDRGDFVNATVSETIGETPGGWYVTGSNSVEGSLAEGTFGTPGLQLDLNDFSSTDEANVVREYSNRDGSTAYEDFEILEFWINSELNSTLTINGETCSQSYNVSTGSWRPVQLNLTEYHSNCGEKIMNWDLSFWNSGEEPVSTQIAVDQFRRYKPTDTGSEAVKALDWLPPEAGVYSFRMDIKNSEYYNTTEEVAVADLEVLSTGGGESATDSKKKIPESGGVADNFEIVQESINQTVGLNTYGELDPITVDNTGTQTLNISTGFPEGSDILENTENTVIEPGEEKDISLRYQTSETGNFVTDVAVFDDISSNRKDIPVNITVAPVEMNITDIQPTYGKNNITPDDNITVKSEITVDGEGITEGVDWEVNVGDTACQKQSQGYSNTTNTWMTNCSAPEIEYNPLQPELELTGSYNGIELRDNQTVGYRDITGPFVESKDAENVKQGQTTEIAVEAWDNTEIANIEGRIEELETGANQGDIILSNSQGDYYNTSFTVQESLPNGDYDAVVNLTDINGNVRTTRVPFSVFPFVEVEGNTTPGTTFEFERPGTDAELESFTTENQSYNFSVQNRTYDTELETDTVNGEGNIQRQNLEFNNATVSGNMSNPINVSGGETGQDVPYEYPDNTTNLTFSHVSYSTGFNYSSAEVTLDYRRLGTSPDEVPEEEFSVYRCPGDDVTSCKTSNWTKLNTSLDTEQDIATAETGTSSSYILAREVSDDGSQDGQDGEDSQGGNEGDSNEDQTGGEDQQDQTGGSSGPSLGGMPSTGDKSNQSEQENKSDIATEPFVLSPRIFRPIMFRGEERTFLLEIDNNREEPIELDMSIQGDIRELLGPDNTEINVSANSTVITELQAKIPEDAEIKTYSGQIVAEYGNTTVNSSQSILVAREGIDGFDLNVKSLTKNVEPGSNFSFETRVSQITMETPLDINMTHYFRESDTDKVIRELNDSIEIEESTALQRELSTQDIPSGSYYIQTVADAKNQTVVDSATVVIEERFWTPFKTRAAILILAVLLISIVGWKGYQYYWTRKEEESRYVFPVDYDRLPAEEEDNYWVGKIAETEKDAYIDPSDLTTHAIVSGSTGSGKSVTANVIAEEALENDVPVIVFDPTAQWTGFVKELKDDDLEEHYDRFEMDPQEDAHPYRGVIKEISSENPDINFEDLQNDGEITVFTLNQLTTEEFDGAVRNIIDQIFDKEWEESPDLEMLIVFDEVHRLLEEYGGQGGYEALEKGAREFRKWGIGLMMASQVTADFKQAISGNIMTEIQMQTKSMEDINRVEKKYGEEFAKRISSEDVGTGMIQNSNYNDGEPWFVDFRPTYHNPHKIPDSEMEKYHNLSEEVDDIKQELKRREDQGQDTRDKDLELQLAENKLKEGRFKMANMYIDSLKDEMDIE